MKRRTKNYEQPCIQLCEVSIETGIAVSPGGYDIYETQAGGVFDEIIYDDEL